MTVAAPAADDTMGDQNEHEQRDGAEDLHPARRPGIRWLDHGPRVLRYIVSLSRQRVSLNILAYSGGVPKLWNKTIESHRKEVREAVLDVTAALVARHGLRSVTMSQIAAAAGIGRATLYKYFPDVEAILAVWHERQVAHHLAQLSHAGASGQPLDRLTAVLGAYATMAYQMEGQARAKLGRHATELATVLHRGAHVAQAQAHLFTFIEGLLAEAAKKRQIRDDVAPAELARYCLHALAAANGAPSKAAVRRLVTMTLAGLRPSAV